MYVKPDLHVKRVLGVLAHQAVGHDVKVPRLAGRVRGEGGRRVADGALQVQRAAEEGGARKLNHTIGFPCFCCVCVAAVQ